MSLIAIDRPPSKLSVKLLVVSGVAVLLTCVWAVFGHRYSNNSIAYQAGTSIVISLAMWGLAVFGFLRREPGMHIRRNLFLVLFGVAFISSLAMAQVPTATSDMAQDQNNYQHEIAAIDAGSILDPQAVAGDPTLAQAKFKAQRAVEIVAKYRTLAIKRLAEAGNPGRTQALIEEKWNYETQAADKELQTVKLLIENRNEWAIQNNNFAFFDKSLLATYDNNIITIRDIAKKGDAVQAELHNNR